MKFYKLIEGLNNEDLRICVYRKYSDNRKESIYNGEIGDINPTIWDQIETKRVIKADLCIGEDNKVYLAIRIERS